MYGPWNFPIQLPGRPHPPTFIVPKAVGRQIQAGQGQLGRLQHLADVAQVFQFAVG